LQTVYHTQFPVTCFVKIDDLLLYSD
jgi:hypothetical protein